jgi:acetyl esterase
MSEISVGLPGKLSDVNATLIDDPRLDPRIAQLLATLGEFSGGLAAPGGGASYEACLAYCAEFEEMTGAGNAELLAQLPTLASVTSSTQMIEGVDGNDIQLYIHRPATSSGPIPALVHYHGGGMVLMAAEDPGPIAWRDALASAGLLVIGVEFRNGGGRMGNHRFPAGLNDCASAAKWVDDNRDELGVSTIVLSGESGGGNLALATALKAKQEGWIDRVDGVYAMCPYIYGDYQNPPAALASLVENDGYMLDSEMMSSLVKVYDPSGEHANNPLAWPYHVDVDTLRGMPPHIISVNELDPLRDEGLAYYRKLTKAGVSAVGRTVHGTPHAGDQSYAEVIPDVSAETVRSILGFVKSL